MSPIFRQTLRDIIIFLMNRKSRIDDHSHVCIGLLGPHRTDSLVIMDTQPADPSAVRTGSAAFCGALSSSRARLGGLLMLSVDFLMSV